MVIYFESNYTDKSISYPFEVVSGGSETQLQVGDKINYAIYRFKG